MRVIFLDIDGVLNNEGSIRSLGTNIKLDPANIQQLNRITDVTGARLVVSSNWREGNPLWVMQAVLGQQGVIGDIIGMTPDLRALEGLGPEDKHVFWVRSREVSRWLAANPWVSRFAIIDDHLVSGFDRGMFKTDHASGLTTEIADAVIDYLR